jgi:pyrroline-5-carboxylate reductase
MSVKPADMAAVLQQLRPFLHGQVVVSFAAGLTRAWLHEQVEGRAHVIRTMPNIPVAVMSGVTAVTCGPDLDAQEREHVLFLLRQLGEVVELSEDMMDAVTAFSGSGPGFVCYVLEAMENAAVQLGFTPETARLLLLQTVVGTARTLDEWGLSPAELRKRVTSKGGTTHAGIQAMQDANLDGIIAQALRAAAQRSAEMGREYRGEDGEAVAPDSAARSRFR